MDLMLDYKKKILQKVSFDRSLFRKELTKAFKWIKKEDIPKLKTWCMATFGAAYADIIKEVFDNIS